jgi:hypothetical protein
MLPTLPVPEMRIMAGKNGDRRDVHRDYKSQEDEMIGTVPFVPEFPSFQQDKSDPPFITKIRRDGAAMRKTKPQG